MGANPTSLGHLSQLHTLGYIPPGARVCSLGATHVHMTGLESSLAVICSKWHVELSPGELTGLASNGFLGDLLRLFGYEYIALDIFDERDVILFDLNNDAPSSTMMDQFDVVLNFGTTEHVLNQYRAMRTIHELTKPGGIMFHDLPFAGYSKHGYFCYTPMFFDHLCRANQYEALGHYYLTNMPEVPTDPEMLRCGYLHQGQEDTTIGFSARRTTLEPFRTPVDVTTSIGNVMTTATGTDSTQIGHR